ncbi:hypothetical protein VNO78_01324 [Psophocarpus tetragonolobus]|uniref:Uncharacterized protein n=1 Tax=Psophocarpus tetragonolobus TaxID=3891 RepID=A0AAN9SXV6_PSOTE
MCRHKAYIEDRTEYTSICTEMYSSSATGQGGEQMRTREIGNGYIPRMEQGIESGYKPLNAGLATLNNHHILLVLDFECNKCHY